MQVTDASRAKVPPVAFSYNYSWTTSPNPIAASIGNNGNKINDGPGPDRDDQTGLQEGGYTLQVTNVVTGCLTSASTAIIKNATPIFITASTVVPKYYCDPSGNINITQVQFQDRAGATQTPAIGNFTFGWTQPSGAAVPVVTTATLDSANFAGIAAGVYRVVATRSVGTPGAGCSSAPVNIEIKDKTVSPVVALTAFNNTSCVAAFEGEIQVQVTDASRAKVPPTAFTYNYDWTSSPNPIPSSPSVGNNGDKINNGAGPDHDDETGLKEGAYIQLSLRSSKTAHRCLSPPRLLFQNIIVIPAEISSSHRYSFRTGQA